MAWVNIAPGDVLSYISCQALTWVRHIVNVTFEHIEAETKWPPFRRRLFKAFSWMEMYGFRFRFHWSLFQNFELTMLQYWYRYWLGAYQVTSHCLDQWWFISLTHVCVTRPQWVKTYFNEIIIQLQKFCSRKYTWKKQTSVVISACYIIKSGTQVSKCCTFSLAPSSMHDSSSSSDEIFG